MLQMEFRHVAIVWLLVVTGGHLLGLASGYRSLAQTTTTTCELATEEATCTPGASRKTCCWDPAGAIPGITVAACRTRVQNTDDDLCDKVPDFVVLEGAPAAAKVNGVFRRVPCACCRRNIATTTGTTVPGPVTDKGCSGTDVVAGAYWKNCYKSVGNDDNRPKRFLYAIPPRLIGPTCNGWVLADAATNDFIAKTGNAIQNFYGTSSCGNPVRPTTEMDPSIFLTKSDTGELVGIELFRWTSATSTFESYGVDNPANALYARGHCVDED